MAAATSTSPLVAHDDSTNTSDSEYSEDEAVTRPSDEVIEDGNEEVLSEESEDEDEVVSVEVPNRSSTCVRRPPQWLRGEEWERT